jgi:hypothetical protein
LPTPSTSPIHTGTTLLVLQPDSAIDGAARAAFDAIPKQQGTLVVAGDSLSWVLYVRSLGVAVEPIRPASIDVATPDGALAFATVARYRLRDAAAEPLLITADGAWLALRKPYQGGELIVIATPEPLLNAGLRDDGAARFVLREILSPDVNHQAVAFDEVHHGFIPIADPGASVTLTDVLFHTAPGQAIVYAAVLLFVYLLLSGRRLGPAVTARAPHETRRTMFEHIQMMANLYRRAGHLDAVRDAFTRHYARLLARVGNGSPGRATALTRALEKIETARSEADLIEAVGVASDTR